MERYYSPAKGFTALVAELVVWRDRQAEVLRTERAENADIIAEVEGDGTAMKSLRGFSDDMAAFALTQRVDSIARRAREVAEAEADRARELADARRQFPDLVRVATELAASGKISATDAALLDIRIAAAGNELRKQ